MTAIKHFCSIWIVFGLIMWCVPAWSQTNDEIIQTMQKQIEILQKRLADLEERNSDLERRLGSQENTTAQQVEKVEKIEKTVSTETKPGITSKFNVDLYGFFKFDAAYDTARTSLGNYARWVDSEMTNSNDDQFNATANQTRFGLKFDGPDLGDLDTSAQVEIDFYGGGAENKANPMMRHAFLQLDWPDSDLSLLAGQTTDIISPLVPSTLNYSVGWWVGNIGYRRPQLRLSKNFDLDNDSSFLFQGGVSRTIGDEWGFHPGDTGEDAGFPTLQGRLAYSLPLLTGKPSTIGVSGHWGQEEYDSNNAGNGNDIDTWSVNVDLTLPLLEKIVLQGEWFLGENLDAYLGGIAQGVNRTLVSGIETTGGWAALSTGPFDRWTFILGGAIDDPKDNDLNAGDRSQNYSIFGNTVYSINQAVQLGFEISYWDTEYKLQDDGDSVRLQTSLIYKF